MQNHRQPQRPRAAVSETASFAGKAQHSVPLRSIHRALSEKQYNGAAGKFVIPASVPRGPSPGGILFEEDLVPEALPSTIAAPTAHACSIDIERDDGRCLRRGGERQRQTGHTVSLPWSRRLRKCLPYATCGTLLIILAIMAWLAVSMHHIHDVDGAWQQPHERAPGVPAETLDSSLSQSQTSAASAPVVMGTPRKWVQQLDADPPANNDNNEIAMRSLSVRANNVASQRRDNHEQGWYIYAFEVSMSEEQRELQQFVPYIVPDKQMTTHPDSIVDYRVCCQIMHNEHPEAFDLICNNGMGASEQYTLDCFLKYQAEHHQMTLMLYIEHPYLDKGQCRLFYQVMMTG